MKTQIMRIIRVVLALIVLILFVWAVAKRLTKKESMATVTSVPVVEAQEPSVKTIATTTELIGKIEPAQVVYVYPKASGEIKEISVRAGDYVEQGQQLCVIDTAQLTSAENSMKSAELSMNEAQDELNRQTILYQNGGLSEQSYAQYRNQAESARLAYENAKETYELQREYSYVTAPISGTIETVGIEMYDQVTTQNLLCVVSGEGDRIVTFSVTERVRGGLSDGDEIQIEKDGVTYTGSIIELSTMPDETTGLYQIKAVLPDEDALVTGASVKITVTTQKAENVMSIPSDAVYYESGKSYVYTYDDGIIHKKEVETGISDNEWTEVASGVDADELIVTTWSSELYEGAQMRLLDDTGDENVQPTEEKSAEAAE